MTDNDRVLSTLVTTAVYKPKPDIDIISTEHVGPMRSARHPAIDYFLRVRETVGEVLASGLIVVASVGKEVPRLSAIWCGVRPIVIVDHVLGFSLGGIVQEAIFVQGADTVGDTSTVGGGE